jgi:hypothetical protein
MERTHVGLDVHARSVVACAFDDVTGELTRAPLVPQPEAILNWLRQLPGPVAVVYKAGLCVSSPAGQVAHRLRRTDLLPQTPLRPGPHPVRRPRWRADLVRTGILTHNTVKIAHLVQAAQTSTGSQTDRSGSARTPHAPSATATGPPLDPPPQPGTAS